MKHKLILAVATVCVAVGGIHANSMEDKIREADRVLKELKKILFAYKQNVKHYGDFFDKYIELKMLVNSASGKEINENELRSEELKDFPRVSEQRMDKDVRKEAIRVAERKVNEMIDALNELEKQLLRSQWEEKEQALKDVETVLFEETVPVPTEKEEQMLTKKQKEFFKERKGTPLAHSVTEEAESDVE